MQSHAETANTPMQREPQVVHCQTELCLSLSQPSVQSAQWECVWPRVNQPNIEGRNVVSG